jgi:signal peptidase I
VDRRDVVVVPHPETGDLLVKRAVGLGGDRVAIEDGVLVVDGLVVCEPSIDPARQDGVWFGPVTVPAGEVFLMGDDRESSIDSRDFGPVPVADVVGRVGVRVWPAPGRLPVDSC